MFRIVFRFLSKSLARLLACFISVFSRRFFVVVLFVSCVHLLNLCVSKLPQVLGGFQLLLFRLFCPFFGAPPDRWSSRPLARGTAPDHRTVDPTCAPSDAALKCLWPRHNNVECAPGGTRMVSVAAHVRGVILMFKKKLGDCSESYGAQSEVFHG